MQNSSPDIIFETERLIVRPFTSADHDNYFALNGNAEVMKYIRPIKTKEECDVLLDESILNAAPHPFMGRWAVDEKSSGLFVGHFVVIPIPDDTERIQLGYSFIPEYWGRGFATEIAKAGLNYFIRQTPLMEIYAVVEAGNIASKKVLVKTGFQFFAEKKAGEKNLLIFIVRR